MAANQPWREHFSANAGDLIAIHAWICGPAMAQRIMMECFKARPASSIVSRINEPTVLRVLDQMHIMIDDDGSCYVPAAKERG